MCTCCYKLLQCKLVVACRHEILALLIICHHLSHQQIFFLLGILNYHRTSFYTMFVPYRFGWTTHSTNENNELSHHGIGCSVDKTNMLRPHLNASPLLCCCPSAAAAGTSPGCCGRLRRQNHATASKLLSQTLYRALKVVTGIAIYSSVSSVFGKLQTRCHDPFIKAWLSAGHSTMWNFLLSKQRDAEAQIEWPLGY